MWPGGLDLKVAVHVGQKVVEPRQSDFLHLAEGVQLRWDNRPQWDEPKGRYIDMHAYDVPSVDAGDLPRDECAPVSALRAAALVPEALHQLCPGLSNVAGGPTGVQRRTREAVVRHGWAHEMKGIIRATTVPRIAQAVFKKRELCRCGKRLTQNRGPTRPVRVCMFPLNDASAFAN